MSDIIKNIPNINMYPLKYVFEKIRLKHKPDTLWLEFGVASGKTINYISKFTHHSVFGFDSFECCFLLGIAHSKQSNLVLILALSAKTNFTNFSL